MRISDWSSDVCSSDLAHLGLPQDPTAAVSASARRSWFRAVGRSPARRERYRFASATRRGRPRPIRLVPVPVARAIRRGGLPHWLPLPADGGDGRARPGQSSGEGKRLGGGKRVGGSVEGGGCGGRD